MFDFPAQRDIQMEEQRIRDELQREIQTQLVCICFALILYFL